MTQVSGSLITRNYNEFRGVDFSNRGDEVNIHRSPDALNMWKNYKNANGKGIETRPDVVLLAEYSSPIFGLFFYDEGALVHSGTSLYLGTTEIYSGMAEHKSNFFVFDNKIYIMDGTNYLQYDGDTVSEVVGFVPTTSISRSPKGGGSIYEDINLLTPYRKNSFCADGESTEYYLDAQNIDNEVPIVWLNDTELTWNIDFDVDYTEGKIIFFNAPPKPDTDGRDNVFVQFKKDTGNRSTITDCTLVELFDNRVFVSGNSEYPNRVWHCSLDDASYFSDLDYYDEGELDSPVMSMVAGNNALWVLKAPSKSNTTIFYHNPTIDSTYGKIYPSTHSSISTGCVTKGINFNDTICFYSENGLEAITGDVTTEQTITHKSCLVDSKLLNEEYFNDMKLVEWQGYLVTIVNDKMYLADSINRQASEVNGHYEYEWYYFDIGKSITCAEVINTQGIDDENLHSGDLVICTAEVVKVDGVPTTKYYVYGLNNFDENREVESYWTTIKDEFNYPQYQKTTNKKGCVVDMEGEDINIYVRTDNNDFVKIKEYDNTKGYVVPRIKKKKWKSIQLMFYSDKPFILYSSTLESYIGSYLKR